MSRNTVRDLESCLQDSPPAAGRFSDILPRRRSAILAERFLFHRTQFPMKQKSRTPLIGYVRPLPFKVMLFLKNYLDATTLSTYAFSSSSLQPA